MENNTRKLTIAIIGGGFSGTAMLAMLHRLPFKAQLEITLFEKSGKIGYGPAYSTPYAHHLLNVRSEDMSPFEDDKLHFANWVYQITGERRDHDFVPRMQYAAYLQDLLREIKDSKNSSIKLSFSNEEVVGINHQSSQLILNLKNGDQSIADKAILAIGNNPPCDFPFPVSSDIHRISNPWDYTAINAVPTSAPVLIVGTGLSMIDAVLSLHYQGHKGVIHAVSRHGLLPLRHAGGRPPYPLMNELLPNELRMLTKVLRQLSKQCINEGEDWRTVINALRADIPVRWQRLSLKDKKRFLRHVLPYWNIHRHRVHVEIMDLLADMVASGQLVIHAGRVKAVTGDQATIRPRHHTKEIGIPAQWVINCMGPVQHMTSTQQPLLQSLLESGLATLDPLALGFQTSDQGALIDQSGQISSQLFTLGPPSKGTFWECTAVPEIRKQVWDLARHLLD